MWILLLFGLIVAGIIQVTLAPGITNWVLLGSFALLGVALPLILSRVKDAKGRKSKHRR